MEPFRQSGRDKPPTAETDEEVMLRLKAGEEDGLDILLNRYRGPIYYHLYRMIWNPARAEELAQDVFLRMYRARKSYKPSAKFSTWLFRIATNAGLNEVRDGRMRKEKEVSSDTEGGEIAAGRVAARIPTPEREVLTAERNTRIRAAVDALPENQKTAVLLHKYQGMDYGEIGKILGVSQSALKSLLFRAYERLRVELRPLVAVAGEREEKEAS